MNIEKLKQAMEVVSLFTAMDDAPFQSGADGRPVIVRSRDAGVLFGNYAGNEGSTVHLENAVQMWRWKAKEGGTLADCAQFGVDASGCKFSKGKAKITIFNACALIDCAGYAAEIISSIEGGDWK